MRLGRQLSTHACRKRFRWRRGAFLAAALKDDVGPLMLLWSDCLLDGMCLIDTGDGDGRVCCTAWACQLSEEASQMVVTIRDKEACPESWPEIVRGEVQLQSRSRGCDFFGWPNQRPQDTYPYTRRRLLLKPPMRPTSRRYTPHGSASRTLCFCSGVGGCYIALSMKKYVGQHD